MKKILTWFFNIYYVVHYGCCENCVYKDICRGIQKPLCSFMEDNGEPNNYKLDTENPYYRFKLRMFLSRFYHKKTNKK